MPSSTPLLSNTNVPPPLYDFDALLQLDASRAQGYLILLTGGVAQDTNPSNLPLAFSALVDGNVVDACFGATDARNASDQVQAQVRAAKQALYNCERPAMAVTAYRQALVSVTQFRQEIDQLNFITKCFRYHGIVNQAKKAVAEAFAPLIEAL